MTTKNRTQKGRFPRGQSGNPSGRPAGSRNLSTLVMEALLEGKAEKLTRKAVELALDGDTRALRLCLDRLMPPGRDRVVFFEFPTVNGMIDVPQGMISIMTAVCQGKISPPEGELLTQMLADYAKVLTSHDMEQRLQKLDQALPHQENNPATPPNELQDITQGHDRG